MILMLFNEGDVRECSLFMGRGGGGLANGRGGQAKFTPLFRGDQKGFILDLGKRGGGGGKNV